MNFLTINKSKLATDLIIKFITLGFSMKKMSDKIFGG